MKRIFPYLIASIFFMSCVSEISVDERISMDNVKPLREIVDSIRYVSLKSDPSRKIFFSGNIDKIMCKGDTMYMADKYDNKMIVAYSKDGECLFKVGERGKGNGEYIEISCFTIDDQYLYCVDNATRKLLIYNIDNGKFVKTYDMPIFARDIAVFEDGKFIFFNQQSMFGSSFKSIGGDYKIFITDQNLKIIDKLFPFSEDYCSVLSMRSVFTENRDKIVFSQMAEDLIVVFDKNSYIDQDYYLVDFGDDKAFMDDKHDEKRLRKTKHLHEPVCIIDSLMIGSVRMPEFGDYWHYGVFVYNMKNKHIYQNANVNDMFKGKTPIDKLVLPIHGVVNNEIISVMWSYELYQNLVKLGFPTAPKYLEKQLEDGEPFLVFYRLKGI